MLINSSGRLFVENTFYQDVLVFSGVDMDMVSQDQLPAKGLCEEFSFPIKTTSGSQVLYGEGSFLLLVTSSEVSW